MSLTEILKRERIMRQKKRALKRINTLINRRIKLRQEYDALGNQLAQELSDYYKRFDLFTPTLKDLGGTNENK